MQQLRPGVSPCPAAPVPVHVPCCRPAATHHPSPTLTNRYRPTDPTAQAVTFLVIGNKPKKTLSEITSDLCPQLSIQQLYRISTMYWDDKYNTETVSAPGVPRCAAAQRRSVKSACGPALNAAVHHGRAATRVRLCRDWQRRAAPACALCAVQKTWMTHIPPPSLERLPTRPRPRPRPLHPSPPRSTPLFPALPPLHPHPPPPLHARCCWCAGERGRAWAHEAGHGGVQLVGQPLVPAGRRLVAALPGRGPAGQHRRQGGWPWPWWSSRKSSY